MSVPSNPLTQHPIAGTNYGFSAVRIADLGATSNKDMGAVMSAVMPALRGRFDGKDAKALVMAALP